MPSYSWRKEVARESFRAVGLIGLFVLFGSTIPLGAQPLSINCGGGPALVGSNGTQWVSDRYFSGGGPQYTSDMLSGTQDVDLMRSARSSPYVDFGYAIPLPNGGYVLRLLFAEVYYWRAGSRVFNVSANGAQILSNFDIAAEVGPRAAVTKEFHVNVTNGSLSLWFQGVKDHGIINAIQIIPEARNYYVSASGTSDGDGSIGHPWDLATALAQPAAVRAGDVIWVRGGTYGTGLTTFLSRLVGNPAAPIIVRAYPGERAAINGWLQVGCCDQNPKPAQGAYVWFWGLEFASSVMDRTGLPNGTSTILNAIDSWAPGSKFINNIIHDTRQGISLWTEALSSEAYGNLIFNNGFQGTDRGHGHGIYTQNNTGRKHLGDNIIFDQYGWGLNVYGTTEASYVRNFDIDGNVSFNNGITSANGRTQNILVTGGIGGQSGIVVKNNHFYNPLDAVKGSNQFGTSDFINNPDFTATNNYFIGGGEAVNIYNFLTLTFTDNTVYGKNSLLLCAGCPNPYTFTWKRNTYFGSPQFTLNGRVLTSFQAWLNATSMDTQSTFSATAPTGVWTFVRANAYETGRAHIVVYNWDQRTSVDVNVSQVLIPGTPYEVRDAQNFYGPAVASGVYSGGTITIPMSGLTPVQPNGSPHAPAVHTAPQFGTFVLLPRQLPG